MKFTVCSSIVYALNAAENAPEDADIAPLIQYCESRGLDEDSIAELLSTPGPTDHGRLSQLAQRLEATEVENATDSTDEQSQGDGAGAEQPGVMSRVADAFGVGSRDLYDPESAGPVVGDTQPK